MTGLSETKFLAQRLVTSDNILPSAVTTFFATKKKKPLDLSRGFCITGGSGEIRTRNQRIKGHKIYSC